MNSELLYITRRLGYPSSFGTRAGLGDFLEQYPDGIYAENGGGAPVGWQSAAVWFGGDSERAAARFERMMAERNELSRLFRTRVSGVLVLTFNYRLKSRMVTAIPIVGGQPAIDPTWLYFTMPEGGAVSLTKNGTPTAVTLEYSLDNGNTWTEWVESENVRSLVLTAGQTMHVRNTSETSTGFSTGTSDHYRFAFTADTYAGGNVESLLCKIPSNVIIVDYCFISLFNEATFLKTIPIICSSNTAQYCFTYMFRNTGITTVPDNYALPTNLSVGCYQGMFMNCQNLETIPNNLLSSDSLKSSCYYYIFYNCKNLILPNEFTLPAHIVLNNSYGSMFANCNKVNKIKTLMTDISASNCITNWLVNVSPTGDFYCPAELTIPTGSSGIPSGWTRHDI